jgi:hypothetical protein
LDGGLPFGKFIRLSRGEEWLFIRCVNRFMEDYKRMLRKKLGPLRFVKWDSNPTLSGDIPCNPFSYTT